MFDNTFVHLLSMGLSRTIMLSWTLNHGVTDSHKCCSWLPNEEISEREHEIQIEKEKSKHQENVLVTIFISSRIKIPRMLRC